MKLRPFELALVVIFLGLALLALFLLGTYDSSQRNADGELVSVGQVTIWGTLPAAPFNELITELNDETDAYRGVAYRYIHPNDFDGELLNALADGVGPDLVVFSHERLVDMRRRVQPVSYDSFPVRDIRNLYVDGAQIFALSDGLYAFPIAVDPLMMYWNRDILATEGYLDPPQTWEVLINSMFPDLIQRDFNRSIERSVVAMGEGNNVRNSFGILSMLLIQGGSQRVTETTDGEYQVRLQSGEDGGNPLRSAADFYTRFSQPSNTLYSWNRSLREDRIQFIAEDLAFYFGYASEGRELERANPNLNFDIAEVPQGANTTERRTYGRFYGIAMLRSSDNQPGASAVMYNFGGGDVAAQIATGANMAPVHRGVVAQGSNDVFGRVAYLSAPIALGWLNPNIDTAEAIFETMAQDINENRRNVSDAASDAATRLTNEY